MFSTTLLIDVLDIRLKMMINTAVVNEFGYSFFTALVNHHYPIVILLDTQV